MCAGRKEPASFQRELCHVRAGPEAPYRGGLAKKGRAVVMGEALPHQPVVLGELDTLHITGREPLWGACVLHAAGWESASLRSVLCCTAYFFSSFR